MATNLGTAIGYLTLDISGFTRGVDQATAQIDRMQGTSSSTLDRISSSATKVGTALTATVTAPFVGFMASAAKEGTNFEYAMQQVSTKINWANEDINEFNKVLTSLGGTAYHTGNDVQDMFKGMYMFAVQQGSETMFTAEEVASALDYMGLAGWSATEILQGLRPVLDLAAAAGEDLGTVSDIVTDSMKALGYEASDTQHYVNVLAEVMRSSNTTVAQAGEAFKYVAPMTGSLGYNIEDLAVAIGEFANVGVKGSQAGTGLRQALNSLTNPSQNAADVLERINWSIYDMTTGKAKPLAQVMRELRDMYHITLSDGNEAAIVFQSFIESLEEVGQLEEFENSSEQAQVRWLSTWARNQGKAGDSFEQIITQWQKMSDVIKLVGIRALPGILGIINDSNEGFQELGYAVYGAQDAYDGMGTAVGMADELMGTTQGSIYKLTSSISEMKIQLFQLIQGPLQSLIDKLTSIFTWFNGLDDVKQKMILNIGGIAAVVGPGLLAFGQFAGAISKIKSAFGETGKSKDDFSKNITGTLNPALQSGEGWLGKVKTAVGNLGNFMKTNAPTIGGIVSILGGVTLECKALVEGLQQGGFQFKQWVEDIVGGILIGLGAFLLGASAPVAAIIGLLSSIFVAIVGNWGNIKEWWTGTALPALGRVWEKLGEFFSGLFGLFGDLIKFLVWDIPMTVIDFFAQVLLELGKFIWDIGQKLGELIDGILETIGQFFKWVWEKVSGFFTETIPMIVGKLGEIIGKVVEFFGNLISEVSTWFGNLLTTIGTWLMNIWTSFTNWLSEVWTKVTTWLNDLWTNISNWFSDLVTSVSNWLSDIWNTVTHKLSEIVSTVWNKLTEIWNVVTQKLGEIVSTVWNKLTEIVTTVGQKIGEIVSTVINKMGEILSTVISKLGEIWSNIVSWFEQLIGKVGQVLGDIISSIIQFGAQTIGEIGSLIGNIISEVARLGSELFHNIAGWFSDVWNEFRNFFGNVLTECWTFLGDVISWIGQFISDSIDGFISGFSDIFHSIVGFASDLKDSVVAAFEGIIEAIGETFSGIASGFGDFVGKVWEGIKQGWDAVVDWFKNIGKNIVEGIWEGISGAAAWAKEKVGGFFGNIVGWAKSKLGIASPSKVFAEQVGAYIPAGIVQGMDQTAWKAQNGITELVDGMVDGALSGMNDAMDSASMVDKSYAILEKTLSDKFTLFSDTVSLTQDKVNLAVSDMITKMYQLYGMSEGLNTIIDKYAGQVKTYGQIYNSSGQAGINAANSNGNTFIFNSPKAINEIEAARQMERSQRTMALGLM